MKAKQKFSKLDRLLHSVREWIPGSWRKAIARIGLAAVVGFGGLAYGCIGKDDIPPVIQEWKAPEWVVEGEDVSFKVDAYDNRKVETVYLQFGDGTSVPLTKTYTEKAEGEKSNWETSLKLSPGEYIFSVVAKDKKNETKADGKITVYPNDADGDGLGYRDELKYGTDPNKKNPVVKYALDKGLEVYFPKLKHLEADEVMDNNEKALIDLLYVYNPKVSQTLPTLYDEVLILPELLVVDEKDVTGLGKIFKAASDPQYKNPFEEMFKEGVPDKRGSCTALQATLWIAYDGDNFYDIIRNYSNSQEKLISFAWKNTRESNNYKSDRWKEFDEVVYRLNSPELVYMYMKDNFSIKTTIHDRRVAMHNNIGIWPLISSVEVFNIKGGVCADQSTFGVRCLVYNGYKVDSYGTNTNYMETEKDYATCHLGALVGEDGHSVVLYVKDGKFYTIDNVLPWNSGIMGPYDTIEKAADATYPGWVYYEICNYANKLIRTVYKNQLKK
ncbi:MAG: hypothetical protein FJ013_05875 [Chloroflexi bacterium]|nr:hypothetical protein [Chloroflexota bacterium]